MEIKRNKENAMRIIRNIEDTETDTFEMVFFINAAGELSYLYNTSPIV